MSVAVLILIEFMVSTPHEFIQKPQEQVLRHVVLIDFTDDATDSTLQNIERDLQGLKENITQIKKLEWGTNIQEGSEYSHCLFMSFENRGALNQYEQHPEHLEFTSTYGKYVAKKTEVDYWY